MSKIDAPLFFQFGKAKTLNDDIFSKTGCFVFLRIGEFPFLNGCENYRQALYSLIIDSYVLFHDYGRQFLNAFVSVSGINRPQTLDSIINYRILLTHSHYEPNIQFMRAFIRLLTNKSIATTKDFYKELSVAKENDYKVAYDLLKDELNIFFYTLNSVANNSNIKGAFINYRIRNINAFQSSLNQALIKSILQTESRTERPNYPNFCSNGSVIIGSFSNAQQSVINKFRNCGYQMPDEIYPDFRNNVINLVNPPQQSSAQILMP